MMAWFFANRNATIALRPIRCGSARISAISIVFVLGLGTLAVAADHRIDLAGHWQVRLDRSGRLRRCRSP